MGRVATGSRPCQAWGRGRARNIGWLTRREMSQCQDNQTLGDGTFQMAISLYDVSVTSYLQTLGAVSGFLDKGLAHCQANGIDPATIVSTRLKDDMLPFIFQIVSVAHHSLGAIEGAKAGVFSPSGAVGELDYAGLQKLVSDARTALSAMTPDEVNALEGRDMVFKLGERKLPFTVPGFLMSFSIPNLHFHATTAYDILRQAGVPLGKRDYLGAMRMKAA